MQASKQKGELCDEPRHTDSDDGQERLLYSQDTFIGEQVTSRVKESYLATKLTNLLG
jgi:hypothetical protein